MDAAAHLGGALQLQPRMEQESAATSPPRQVPPAIQSRLAFTDTTTAIIEAGARRSAAPTAAALRGGGAPSARPGRSLVPGPGGLFRLGRLDERAGAQGGQGGLGGDPAAPIDFLAWINAKDSDDEEGSEMPAAADATELPDAAEPAGNARLLAIDQLLLAWRKDALKARWPEASARGLVGSFEQAFEPVAEGERADGAVAALHERDAAVERLRVDGKRPKVVSHDTLSLSRASGGLAKETTWLHGDSMAESNELSRRQRHSAGFYTARGGVSPQLQCMIKGDETRGVVACAFDGCTGALPGQGHGVEPVTALYRPATQLSAPIVRALALDGRVKILLLQGRKPNQTAWWDKPVAQLATRHVDLTASTLEHAPAIVGCARPSPSTFGLKDAKVIGFEFEQLGGELAYLVKLPELSESGSTMSPCFARCPQRALRNALEIAFVEILASALLTRAQGPPRALREHGVVQLTKRYWRLGDEDGAVEWVEGWEERRGRHGRPVGSGSGPSHGVPGLVEISLLCPDGHLFWHERAQFSNGADSLDTARTMVVGVTPGGRFRAGAGKKALHDCAKCKLGHSAYGGSKVTVHFQLDGTCRCRWRDGSWTNGRWHERTETEEERGGPCELCEELREDEA